MNPEVSRITFRNVVYCIRRRILLILLCALAGFVIGVTIWVVQSAMASNSADYKIDASIAISTRAANGLFVGGSYQSPNATDIYLAEDITDAVIYVCSSDAVLDEVVKKNNLVGLTAESIRKNLSLSQYAQTQIIEIALIWPDATDGAAILSTMTEIVPQILIDTLQLGSVSVINAPTSKRVTYEFISTGGIAMLTFVGMLLGMLLSIHKLIFHPTLLDPKDVGRLFSLLSLGEIPDDKSSSGLLNTSDKSSSTILESYVSTVRILMNQLDSVGPQKLCITSSIQGEGKTTVAANMAYQMSKLGKKVLLLDMDLRKPSLGSLFLEKTDHNLSLNAAYYDEIDISQAIVSIAPGLDFIPTRLEKRSVLLDKKVFQMIGSIESRYDIILMDTSPAGQVADVMSLTGFADKVLYVIRFDAARVDAIQSDLERLRKAGMQILGCIVNGLDTKFTNNARYYSYHYRSRQYGYGVYGLSSSEQDLQRSSKPSEKEKTSVRAWRKQKNSDK